MAESQGLTILENNECTIQGKTIDCNVNPFQKTYILSVYNSNLSAEKGFFLRVNEKLIESLSIQAA